MRKAHPRAIYEEQERIARDLFVKKAGSHNLLVWLKADKPKTIEGAIDLAIQFEQATAANVGSKPKVQSADLSLTNLFVEEGTAPAQVLVASESVAKVESRNGSSSSGLEDQVKLLTEELRALAKQLKSSKSYGTKQPPRCYGYNELGHFKRDCPKLKSQDLNSRCEVYFHVKGLAGEKFERKLARC